MNLDKFGGRINLKMTGENTLQTSGEDAKIHSKRVEKSENTLQTSGKDQAITSTRTAQKGQFHFEIFNFKYSEQNDKN